MIMLIGLPASGKTTWANKHVEENPLKRYNVIGTSVLLERMKVSLFFYQKIFFEVECILSKIAIMEHLNSELINRVFFLKKCELTACRDFFHKIF